VLSVYLERYNNSDDECTSIPQNIHIIWPHTSSSQESRRKQDNGKWREWCVWIILAFALKLLGRKYYTWRYDTIQWSVTWILKEPIQSTFFSPYSQAMFTLKTKVNMRGELCHMNIPYTWDADFTIWQVSSVSLVLPW